MTGNRAVRFRPIAFPDVPGVQSSKFQVKGFKMTDGIVKAEAAMAMPNIAALQKASDELVVGGDGVFGVRLSFLPYIQLYTGNSKPVQTGKIQVAHYGINKGQDLISLGKEVLCVPLAWRPKCMDINGDKPKSYFKPNSDIFKQLKARAEADSNSGVFYGPEFLLWIPDHGFVTFMFGSKTARNEAPALKALLPSVAGVRTAVLSSNFIETDSYAWHGPKVSLSSQVLSDLPLGEVEGYVTDFLNPSDSKEDEVAPTEVVKADR